MTQHTEIPKVPVNREMLPKCFGQPASPCVDSGCVVWAACVRYVGSAQLTINVRERLDYIWRKYNEVAKNE